MQQKLIGLEKLQVVTLNSSGTLSVNMQSEDSESLVIQ
jgi:hypothetical protein